MKRSQLEHLIRAAAAITNECEIVVVGSQSILGAVPAAPEFPCGKPSRPCPLPRSKKTGLSVGLTVKCGLYPGTPNSEYPAPGL